MKVGPFYIQIQIDRKPIRLKVVQENITISHEEFVVIARNGRLVFKSNRPLLRYKGIKKRDPDFKAISGQLKYRGYEREIIKAIINHLDRIEKENIPISFDHRGKVFSGHFAKVAGGGNSSLWHLQSHDGYYMGSLNKNGNGEWVFHGSSKKDELEYLSSFFANYLHEKGVLE